MVTELVRDDVLLCEWPARGAKAVHELLEEAHIEVRGPVGRAVERTDLAGGIPAASGHRTGEQAQPGLFVGDTGLFR